MWETGIGGVAGAGVAGRAAFFAAGRCEVAVGRTTDSATPGLLSAADGAAGTETAGAGAAAGVAGIGVLGLAGCWAAQPSSSR